MGMLTRAFKSIPEWLTVPAAKAEIIGITAKAPGGDGGFPRSAAPPPGGYR